MNDYYTMFLRLSRPVTVNSLLTACRIHSQTQAEMYQRRGKTGHEILFLDEKLCRIIAARNDSQFIRVWPLVSQS